MPEVDERGVVSAQDQKDLKHVPEEDVNNPQVWRMIFTDLPAKRALYSRPFPELVIDGKTLHIPDHLFLYLFGQCKLQQLHGRNAGHHQGISGQPNPGRAVGLLQCVPLRRGQHLLGSPYACYWKATRLPPGHAYALHDERVV